MADLSRAWLVGRLAHIAHNLEMFANELPDDDNNGNEDIWDEISALRLIVQALDEVR